jgi:UV DNA damage endonuclease
MSGWPIASPGIISDEAMTEHPRLGYCCTWVSPTGDAAAERAMNVAGLTISYVNRLGPAAGFDKLSEVVTHNLAALRAQVEHVAALPPFQRLLRVISQLLPGYAHPDVAPLYRDRDLTALIETSLAETGRLAREAGVRLSMHPSQHAILATGEAALANAIGDIDHHVEIMQMLGLGGGWHPHGAHINIHGGARGHGVDGIRAGLARLSGAARNLVTIENDEMSFGLDDLLELAGEVAIVLDLHHHWIHSRGQYIEPEDPRIPRIVDAWRGVRPVSHVSVSREALLPGHDPDALPDYAALIAGGLKVRDLRGHSDLMWNRAVSDLVGRHLAWSDFEIEAKSKNLASQQIADHLAPRFAPGQAGAAA